MDGVCDAEKFESLISPKMMQCLYLARSVVSTNSTTLILFLTYI